MNSSPFKYGVHRMVTLIVPPIFDVGPAFSQPNYRPVPSQIHFIQARAHITPPPQGRLPF